MPFTVNGDMDRLCAVWRKLEKLKEDDAARKTMHVVYFVVAWETGKGAMTEYIEAMDRYDEDCKIWGQLEQGQHDDLEIEPPTMPLLKQHLQGYIVFRKPVSRTYLQELLGCPAHVEQAKGNHEQNRKYCTKEDTDEPNKEKDIMEAGQLPTKRGQRTDLTAVRMELQGPGSKRERLLSLANGDFALWMRNYRAMDTYVTMFDESKLKPRKNPPVVLTYWGDAGTGKTRKVYALSPDVYSVPISSSSSLWFDGYNGYDDVLFDDFYGGIQFGKMLKLLDRYPQTVPVKGGFVKWQPKRIFITSNTDPKDWYPGVPAQARAGLRRRMTENGSKITRFIKPMMVLEE